MCEIFNFPNPSLKGLKIRFLGSKTNILTKIGNYWWILGNYWYLLVLKWSPAARGAAPMTLRYDLVAFLA